MERVMVIGCPGSGKTTFSVKLAALTSLPLTHLDRLYWRDGWQRVSREEFDEELARVLAGERWVIDGNFLRTVPVRMKRADTVIWFDCPALLCFFGVLERFFKNYKKSRDDMGGYCPETLDREKLSFFFSVFRFNKTNRPKIRAALAENPDVNLVVFKSRRQAEKYLAALSGEAGRGGAEKRIPKENRGQREAGRGEETKDRTEDGGGEEKENRTKDGNGKEENAGKPRNGKKERSDGPLGA